MYAVSYTVCWAFLCNLARVLHAPAACVSLSFVRTLRPARRNGQALSVVCAHRATISRLSSADAGGTHCAYVLAYLGSEAVMAPLRIARDACAAGALRHGLPMGLPLSSEYAVPRGGPLGDRVTLCLL